MVALHRELQDGSYRHGPYRYFEVHDPKTRTVAAAAFRDRVVHHAIVRVLEPIFERRLIEDTYACRTDKGTDAALRRAAAFTRRHAYALECDVSRFFPSIDHDVLMGQVERVIADERLLGLLRHVLASHANAEETEWIGEGLFDVRMRRRGIPIDNLTSQFLANVHLSPLDHFVKHALRVRGDLRYIDDLVLFGDDPGVLRAQGRAVKEQLAALRLRMHPDKYRLRPTALGVDFVGYVAFRDGRIRMRRASVRRFERRYRRRRFLVERKLADPADLAASVRSWVAHALNRTVKEFVESLK